MRDLALERTEEVPKLVGTVSTAPSDNVSRQTSEALVDLKDGKHGLKRLGRAGEVRHAGYMPGWVTALGP